MYNCTYDKHPVTCIRVKHTPRLLPHIVTCRSFEIECGLGAGTVGDIITVTMETNTYFIAGGVVAHLLEVDIVNSTLYSLFLEKLQGVLLKVNRQCDMIAGN